MATLQPKSFMEIDFRIFRETIGQEHMIDLSSCPDEYEAVKSAFQGVAYSLGGGKLESVEDAEMTYSLKCTAPEFMMFGEEWEILPVEIVVETEEDKYKIIDAFQNGNRVRFNLKDGPELSNLVTSFVYGGCQALFGHLREIEDDIWETTPEFIVKNDDNRILLTEFRFNRSALEQCFEQEYSTANEERIKDLYQEHMALSEKLGVRTDLWRQVIDYMRKYKQRQKALSYLIEAVREVENRGAYETKRSVSLMHQLTIEYHATHRLAEAEQTVMKFQELYREFFWERWMKKIDLYGLAAGVLFSEGKLDKVREMMQQYAQEQENNDDLDGRIMVECMEAKCCLAEKKIRKAKSLLEKTTWLYPESAAGRVFASEARERLANIYRKEKKGGKAIPLLESIISWYEMDHWVDSLMKAVATLIPLYIQENKISQLDRLYESVRDYVDDLQNDIDKAVMHANFGVACMQIKKFDDAKTHLGEALYFYGKVSREDCFRYADQIGAILEHIADLKKVMMR